MKFKTVVAVAVSSIFAASLAYAAPSSNAMDDTSTMQSTPASQENIGSMQGANSPLNSADMGVPGPASSNTPESQQVMPSDMNSNSDDMNADTATGDDDY